MSTEVWLNYVSIRRGSFMSGPLDCGDKDKDKDKDWQDRWTTFDHPDLLAPVRIHGGHACADNPNDANWDNIWIEWNGQHIDVPGSW